MRIKIFFTSLLIISLSTSLKSQSIDDTTNYLKKTIVRLQIIPVGLSIEKRLTKKATLLFDFGAEYTYQSIEINGKKNREFLLIPYFAIEPRIYTNLKDRKVKGKRIDFHSGAYGAFRVKGDYDYQNNWSVQFGPLVGFQRTLGRKGYWSISIGCGSTFMEEDIKFGLIGDLKLGFIIN